MASLLFKANANYETWSIDFGYKVEEIKRDQKRETKRDRAKEVIYISKGVTMRAIFRNPAFYRFTWKKENII